MCLLPCSTEQENEIVCEDCKEIINDQKVLPFTKFLPQGLLLDPLEIRFETTGIKYKNRRIKWKMGLYT